MDPLTTIILKLQDTVKLGAPHTIERTRSDGIFLECRRRCRADAWTTRLGMNAKHWGET